MARKFLSQLKLTLKYSFIVGLSNKFLYVQSMIEVSTVVTNCTYLMLMQYFLFSYKKYKIFKHFYKLI